MQTMSDVVMGFAPVRDYHPFLLEFHNADGADFFPTTIILFSFLQPKVRSKKTTKMTCELICNVLFDRSVHIFKQTANADNINVNNV